jgi:hypothetical protein
MQFSLSSVSSNRVSSRATILSGGLSLAAIALGFASAQIGSVQFAWAGESAYIQQAAGGSGTPKYFIIGPNTNSQTGNSAHTNSAPIPELFTPTRNGNVSGSLTVGSFNNIAQIQAGKNDASAVSILGGKHDNVGVLQAGNNVTSNIALIGLQGVNLGIIQGLNAPPINMIIARLPNGSIMIRR